MKPTIISLAVSLAVATPLMAEEVGQITADLDGETRQWFTISIERGDQKALSASFRKHKSLPSLSVQGHPEARFTTSDVLSLSGSWFGGYDLSKPVNPVEIIFLPQGMSKPFYTSDQVPEAPVMTIEELELGDEMGRVKGNFSGKICLVAGLYEEPDMSDCKTITGTFYTEIQVN